MNRLSIKNIKEKNTSFNRRRIRNLFSEIWESIGGTERDFTKGSISKAILLLSIPMVLEMIMESIFAVVDIYFVAKLGPNAIATVGITESLITIVYAIGIGLSTATVAMVARRVGEKKPKEAADTAFQAIFTGIIISLIIAVPGVIYAQDLLGFMGAEQALINDFSSYTSIMLGGNITIILLFIINAIFRSAGDAAMSLRVLFLANMINIVLDPCLIFGWGPFPEMGIVGAAVATNTGRGIAVLYQLYILFNGNSRVKLLWKTCVPNYKRIYDLVKLSLGGIGQMLIATSSWVGLVKIISVFGSEVLAGYTIGIRIIIFAILPSFGISNAAATLVGQNLGANSPDRAEKSVWYTSRVNLVLLGFIGLFMIFYSGQIVGLFSDNEVVIESGRQCLQIVSYGFLSYGVGMVLVNSFNGAGDTITPTWINFICFWMIEIPLAYILAIKMGMEEKGVYYSIIVAETLMTLIAAYLFKKGKWKEKVV